MNCGSKLILPLKSVMIFIPMIISGTIAHAQYATNLIQNSGAESGSGSSITDWDTHGTSLTIVSYGAPGGFPDSNSPGPTDRGNNFFAGGPSNSSSEAEQLIDVTPESAGINSGTVTFTLSGWLGGFSSQNDNATLTADFLGTGNSNLGSANIGPVFANDRNDVTGMIFETINGNVPVGTQSVDLFLNMNRTDGDYNDGYADNLSFELFNSPQNQTSTPEPNGILSVIIGCVMSIGFVALRKYRKA
jgi:hypothetical protein